MNKQWQWLAKGNT